MEERSYWLAFSVCSGIGPVRFSLLLRHFGSAEAAWQASKEGLIKAGIGQKQSSLVVAFQKTFAIEQYEERMRKGGVSYCTLQEETYPQLLKEIKNPPFVLYGRGEMQLLSGEQVTVAVVGTRKVTTYGREVTRSLVTDLALSGCVIVSGLAMGVDAVAHQSTLDAGGKTIAVLGSGVDVCTPNENRQLYDRILAGGGLIISENPLERIPNKGSFPARNRIIAGLSQGILVTEGAEDSGSLITANDGLNNERKVFAVPGQITSSVSNGPNTLLARGAILVQSAKDILNALHMKTVNAKAKQHIKGDSEEEQKIIDAIHDQNMHMDELVRKTGIPTQQLSTILSFMEMKGYIVNGEGGVVMMGNY
jgi:DNA processing protein